MIKQSNEATVPGFKGLDLSYWSEYKAKLAKYNFDVRIHNIKLRQRQGNKKVKFLFLEWEAPIYYDSMQIELLEKEQLEPSIEDYIDLYYSSKEKINCHKDFPFEL